MAARIMPPRPRTHTELDFAVDHRWVAEYAPSTLQFLWHNSFPLIYPVPASALMLMASTLLLLRPPQALDSLSSIVRAMATGGVRRFLQLREDERQVLCQPDAVSPAVQDVSAHMHRVACAIGSSASALRTSLRLTLSCPSTIKAIQEASMPGAAA